MSITASPELVPVLSKYGTSMADLPTTPEAAQSVANAWIAEFAPALKSGKADAVLAHFISDAPAFRDLFALSWEIRTLIGPTDVHAYLAEHLVEGAFTTFEPAKTAASLLPLGPDVGWVNAYATFETKERHGTALMHLVPTRTDANAEVVWKAQGALFDLDHLVGHPESKGARSNRYPPAKGGYEEALAKKHAFEEEDPTVVIVGGGHCGLQIAARLKVQGISCLVLERAPRLGDSWRGRYESLCLHDPAWYNAMALVPYPPTWPTYAPARKFANWLESYASMLELPVWLNTNVDNIYRDASTDGWRVDITSKDGKKTLKPKHVVTALGWGSGAPFTPAVAGMDDFAGKIMHSAAFQDGRDHAGKKVVVIGGATSGHDVCAALATHGVDVTMVQRGPTHVYSTDSMERLVGFYTDDGQVSTETSDRIVSSFTLPVLMSILPGLVAMNAQADGELLEGLRKRGFALCDGPDGTGAFGLAYERGGGYYINTGASNLIIDGSIKVKSDSKIEKIDKEGVVFEDGTKLAADTIIFATGYEDATKGVQRLLAPKEAAALRPVWKLDEGHEMGGQWQFSGLKNFHVMLGWLHPGRYYSKHLALRIKAIEEGLVNDA